jgi:hypothetical protein
MFYAFDHVIYAFQSIFVHLWYSSCNHDPRTSQVHVQVMHLFRGRHALDTLRLTESRLEGVNRAKLKFTKLITTTSRVSV